MTSHKFCITGIGASSGGIDALENFFRKIPADPGTSFVIIQHLNPEYENFSKDIISKFSKLPVSYVSKNTKPKINQIYLMPSTHNLYFEDGYIIPVERKDKSSNYPIDIFFHSLAKEYKERAISIIFSGLGTDGSQGVLTVKEQGGVVMIQSPDSAVYKGMIHNAISSDDPDYIAAPERLAEKLLDFLKNPNIFGEHLQDMDVESEKETVNKIIRLVSEFSRVNFGVYKVNTVVRRIEKRIKINQLNSAEEYLDFLLKNPNEVRVLFSDLLIGVTEFFRNPEAFEELKENVVKELLKDRPEYDQVRIWVSACSTGEEAYSIAMLFDEVISSMNLNIDYKIFATDLSKTAIEIASFGRYRENIEGQVSQDRLDKYFNRNGNFYEVRKEIRKHIIFSVHNILEDPPFIKLDLISCRNLFIYLKDEEQKKLINNFSYALKEDGYMFLGSNEFLKEMETHFDKVDIHHKIFKNKKNGQNVRMNEKLSYERSVYPTTITKNDHTRRSISNVREHELYSDLLVEKYAPPCVLVNDNDEVLYTKGRLNGILTFPNDRSNLNLFNMVYGTTSIIIRNGLRKVREEKKDIVIKNNKIGEEGEKFNVDILFTHVYSKKNNCKYILIEFHRKNREVPSSDVEELSKENLREIERLEMELNIAREELRQTSDEMETLNEELQSSNEEMRSSNEEMQSTNEEMQSANEELKTVNQELKYKIDELTVLHNDVNNLFISTEIATLFLDLNFNIRKFTPAAQKYFNIRENDTGRPLSHYTHSLEYDDLFDDLEKVLENLKILEKEVSDNEDRYYNLKILPYKADNHRISGVIITIVDITELKRANLSLIKTTENLQKKSDQLEVSQQHFKSLVENIPDLVMRVNEENKMLYLNRTGFDILGISKKDKSSLDLSEVHSLQNNFPVIKSQISEVLNHERKQNFNLEINNRHFYFSIVPEHHFRHSKSKTMLIIGRDITDLHRKEQEVENKNQRLEAMNRYMENFVQAIAHDLRTPLTHLKVLFDLIESEDDDNKRDSYIRKAPVSLKRLNETLNGLLEIIEVQNLGTDNMVAEVSFEETLNKAFDELFIDFSDVEYELNTDFQVGKIRYVAPYLNSIFRNLLSNSFKYNVPGRKIIIDIATHYENDQVKLTFKDNGMGIDKKIKDRELFSPFKRFSKVGEGKGLGLYIIKNMIKKNNGKIMVESEVNKGSTFHIWLKEYNKKPKRLETA